MIVISCLVLQQAATAVPAPQAPGSVRFHHVHYRVSDPGAAINEVALRTGGVRVIAPGLGVGVRAGQEYALFDRFDASDPERLEQPALPQAYASAVRWLEEHGIAVEPLTLTESLIGNSSSGVRRHHIGFAAADLAALDGKLRAAAAPVIRRSADAVLVDAGDGLLVEIVRDTDREDAYWCPMHPDVRAPEAGTCLACGMDLVPIPPPQLGEYAIDVTQLPEGRSVAGLDIAVREPGTGALVTKFAVVHEQPFHLFVVSRDLRYFAHVHPEARPDGSFRLRHSLEPGSYMLLADFLPEGGTSQMVQRAIIVPGEPRRLPVADESNGLRVRLETDALAVGRHALLTFTVEDALTGEPVTDLQPYLGAPAHMLIVRSDLGDAVHAHPDERDTRGPTVSFHPLIPAPGDYRLWIQVQRAGTISTTAFDLRVER